MLKIPILSFLLLLLALSSISQTPQAVTQTTIKTPNYDSLLRLSQDQNRVLSQKIDVQSAILSANSSLFSSLSAYFTLISILMTLLFIGLPLANYFLVIKPNKSALKKLATFESTISSRIDGEFEIYVSNYDKRQFKKALSMLNDKEKWGTAVSILFTSNHSDLDQDDFKALYDFLSTDPDMDEFNFAFVFGRFSSQETLYGEKYFKSIIEKGEAKHLTEAIRYLLRYGIDKHMAYLENIIKPSLEGRLFFLKIFNEINQYYLGNQMQPKPKDDRDYGEAQAVILLNNKTIINAVKDHMPDKRSQFSEININTLHFNPFLKDTYYYKEVIEKQNQAPRAD